MRSRCFLSGKRGQQARLWLREKAQSTGSRWSKKMAARGGKLSGTTSSTVPTHTLALGQSQAFKKLSSILHLRP